MLYVKRTVTLILSCRCHFLLSVMFMHNDTLRKWNATASYALLQSATWGFYAIILSFSSNVLYDFGLTDSQISLFLSISTAISFLSQLAIAELVSRRPKVQVWRILLVLSSAILAAALLLLLPEVNAGIGITAFALSCMILQIFPSLANAAGMDAIKRGAPTVYSFARGMSSLAYSLLALITGILVRRFGTRMVPLLTAITAAGMILATLWHHHAAEKNLPAPVTSHKAVKKGNFLVQYPRFGVFLIGGVFLCVSQNLLTNFMYQIMLIRSGGAEEQGIATSICALVELPVMFLFPVMMRRTHCSKWVRIAAASMILKPLCIFLSGSVYGVYLAQVTQMIGYGLYAISSVYYAESVVKKGESVQAQSYLGASRTMGSLFAMSTGGVICEIWGAQAMVLASLLCSILGCVTITLAARKSKP